MPRPLSTSGKDPVPIVQEAEWAPGPVWTGEENLAPTWIRSPDRPTRSQSLHRLSYQVHRFVMKWIINEKVQFVIERISTFLNSLESNRIKTSLPRRLNTDCRLVDVCMCHGWAYCLHHWWGVLLERVLAK
jgi:hypothetical protein